MKQMCEGCGEIFDEVWMMSYNTGRRTHWFFGNAGRPDRVRLP